MKLIYTKEVEIDAEPSLFERILERLPTVHEDISQNQVELLITDNQTIQVLNKKYRGKDAPTDVLSFPFEDKENLGQIVISLDRAKEQALDLNQSLEEELKFLFAHGVLHLLGYDHHKPEEEKVMLAKTYKLLNR